MSTNPEDELLLKIAAANRKLEADSAKMEDFQNQIKLAESEVEAAKSMVQFENEQLRKIVITLYQDLLLKQKLLQIRSESLGDGRVNMQMVEKEFRNGVVPLSEYVRINSTTTDMEAAYETALSEFITTKKMLEDMAGFVFNLKRSN
jgi:outer membrane protein TolC